MLITLYVDNKTPLTKPVKIVENGTERTLRTVGDKWSYLQRVKFGANAQPFYVLLDNEGKPLNKSYAYNEDIPKYIEFLRTGLENYRNNRPIPQYVKVPLLRYALRINWHIGILSYHYLSHWHFHQ